MSRLEFGFRPWVRSTCRSAMLWGMGVVAIFGLVSWWMREPGSAPLSRAFGVLAFYGALFMLYVAPTQADLATHAALHANASSMGFVIWVSITRALAPGYVVATVTMGSSTLGTRRTDSRSKQIRPIEPK